jgi:hypothetical protein
VRQRLPRLHVVQTAQSDYARGIALAAEKGSAHNRRRATSRGDEDFLGRGWTMKENSENGGRTMHEGQAVYHPKYGKTRLDCIPLKPAFGSTERGDQCYLARVTSAHGETHDPWVALSELIGR